MINIKTCRAPYFINKRKIFPRKKYWIWFNCCYFSTNINHQILQQNIYLSLANPYQPLPIPLQQINIISNLDLEKYLLSQTNFYSEVYTYCFYRINFALSIHFVQRPFENWCSFFHLKDQEEGKPFSLTFEAYRTQAYTYVGLVFDW